MPPMSCVIRRWSISGQRYARPTTWRKADFPTRDPQPARTPKRSWSFVPHLNKDVFLSTGRARAACNGAAPSEVPSVSSQPRLSLRLPTVHGPPLGRAIPFGRPKPCTLPPSCQIESMRGDMGAKAGLARAQHTLPLAGPRSTAPYCRHLGAGG
ncbi:hypothetical protein C8Q78DRAFT_140317 [Trametes maxima]|nr:hypothetical protein C8Q78DRAFT_140317 [Trametes maxima]